MVGTKAMGTALNSANTLPQALGEVSDSAQSRERLTLDQTTPQIFPAAL